MRATPVLTVLIALILLVIAVFVFGIPFVAQRVADTVVRQAQSELAAARIDAEIHVGKVRYGFPATLNFENISAFARVPKMGKWSQEWSAVLHVSAIRARLLDLKSQKYLLFFKNRLKLCRNS